MGKSILQGLLCERISGEGTSHDRALRDGTSRVFLSCSLCLWFFADDRCRIRTLQFGLEGQAGSKFTLQVRRFRLEPRRALRELRGG